MHGYLELSFELGALSAPEAEQACLAEGALAVTLCDAVDEPVLEPLPGELRLWRRTRMQALFPAATADALLIVALAQRLDCPPGELEVRAVADRVWEREWLRDFHAMRFGERLWICPRHEQPGASGAVVVRLDPGLAFGTGTHPSTALCLQWLDELSRTQSGLIGCTVIDYGCGSGVLGLAALALGARRVHAFDIDPQALLATRENAEDNHVADQLRTYARAEDLPARCDVLLANILAPILKQRAAEFAGLLPAGSRLILAGLLAEESTEVATAFDQWFDMQRYAQRDGWVALSGTRL
ncbi:MAG TPA: 50S ribosomal protein L11 methyltransferase [Steroidobacteraceae bacterium]|nr:50S ribosomal protein L11 methyltransferase [Steroidobacteraceae bacterium]